MKSKSSKLDKFLKIVIIFSIIMITWSIVYYFMVFLPEKEQSRLDEENRLRVIEDNKKAQQKNLLDNCLSAAQTSYIKQWNVECDTLRLLNKKCKELIKKSYQEYLSDEGRAGEDSYEGTDDKYYEDLDDCACKLPGNRAKDAEEYRQELKNDCFKKYPQ
jgi:hypothetical protein